MGSGAFFPNGFFFFFLVEPWAGPESMISYSQVNLDLIEGVWKQISLPWHLQ